jgi:hypothetical protein
MGQVLTKNEYPREDYYFGMLEDMRLIFTNYGMWLQRKKLSDNIENYVEYLNNQEVIENEDKIKKFISRLKTGEYKVILYNGQSPILKDNMGFADLVICDLNEDSRVELIDNDVIVIHTDRETIELKGYKDMNSNEIIARKYLDECQNDLVIKDNEEQLEFREENFHKIDVEDYYDKCKDIIDIDIFIGDESDPIWRMNWDAIWVEYSSGLRELWQKM